MISEAQSHRKRPLWAFLGMARWKWVVRLESHSWRYTSMNSLALFRLCYNWCTKSLSYIKDWQKRCCSVLYCTFFVSFVSAMLLLSALPCNCISFLLLVWFVFFLFVFFLLFLPLLLRSRICLLIYFFFSISCMFFFVTLAPFKKFTL